MCPANKIVIGTRCTFRNKMDENGIITRKNSRLMEKGYNQDKWVDYNEAYALIAHLEEIRLLLAFTYFLGFNLYQMDVKSTFLYKFINEE